MSPNQALFDQFMAELTLEFPNFRVVPKRASKFSRVIDVLLRIVTLNQMRTFLTEYHTVIGDTLYVPNSWGFMRPIDKIILLRHERVHLRQRRRLTLVGMAFVYLVPIFPLGLAYGRAKLEWEAYAETVRATYELVGASAANNPELRRQIIGRFCSPDYGWMWPFRAQLNRWYDALLEDLEG